MQTRTFLLALLALAMASPNPIPQETSIPEEPPTVEFPPITETVVPTTVPTETAIWRHPDLIPTPKAPFPIYNFSSTVTPENLDLRRNGQLLVSDLTGPFLYQLDPTQGPGQTVKVVHEFKGYSSTTGLVELEEDVFALGVGNFTLADGPTRGTWKIWRIDLRSKHTVRVEPLVSAPDAMILGEITAINASAGLLAATDYVQGTLWLLDLLNNRTTPIITSPELATTTVGSGGDIGFNGLKYRNGRLYFQVTTTGL
ncbi:hypothetical protein PRZ48_005478 [Zasmidium cellare]|uniref:Uncharacterized protein n=1 Tax=Zasmidium cellare TaxID=395010 RepID=A0ABR0ESV0_ZASCE|nr:hypothetical protein PRZ48_005478 [Zasmidium cellare]